MPTKPGRFDGRKPCALATLIPCQGPCRELIGCPGAAVGSRTRYTSVIGDEIPAAPALCERRAA